MKSIIENFPPSSFKTCFTGQHKDLINLSDIPKPDHTLTIDQPKFRSTNRLNNIFCNILEQTEFLQNSEITKVLVQGDTTSATAIALSAFHNNIPIIHLEAGLRTYDIKNPFPEEFNRQTISKLATIHLCPTVQNAINLQKEPLKKDAKIKIVGNTGLDNINRTPFPFDPSSPSSPSSPSNSIILITLHRSSNVPNIPQWFTTINDIAKDNPKITFTTPLHPNPDIQKHKHLLTNVQVTPPLTHSTLITTIKQSIFIITDSGGIQEEASFLNKRIIVCRATTERPEILNTFSELCPTPSQLPKTFVKFLDSPNPPPTSKCPYGDGKSWKKIQNVLL